MGCVLSVAVGSYRPIAALGRGQSTAKSWLWPLQQKQSETAGMVSVAPTPDAMSRFGLGGRCGLGKELLVHCFLACLVACQ